MRNRIRLLLIAVTPTIAAAPLSAQTADRLEPQYRATAKVPTGLGLVREQVRDGHLTEALATVERVIILDPLNAEARLLHASILCRLDDRPGSRTEFDPMRGYDFSDDMWREETAHCEEPKPGAGR